MRKSRRDICYGFIFSSVMIDSDQMLRFYSHRRGTCEEVIGEIGVVDSED
jgi:hypothetical protein